LSRITFQPYEQVPVRLQDDLDDDPGNKKGPTSKGANDLRLIAFD